jgi:predicted RNA-binding Zn ribbon-like protein
MSSTGSRVDSIRLVGGRPCLDLVNTVSWRGDPGRREDHLRSARDCLVWSVRAGVLSAGESRRLARRANEDLVTELVAVRNLITEQLVDAEAARLAELTPTVVSVLAQSELVAEPSGAHWAAGPLDSGTPVRRIVLDLYELLRFPGGRLGVCADADCRWAYLDVSRRQDRRWCSSADCGNRDRARRHYAARPSR